MRDDQAASAADAPAAEAEEAPDGAAFGAQAEEAIAGRGADPSYDRHFSYHNLCSYAIPPSKLYPGADVHASAGRRAFSRQKENKISRPTPDRPGLKLLLNFCRKIPRIMSGIIHCFRASGVPVPSLYLH